MPDEPASTHPDITALDDALDRIAGEARALVDGLDEEAGTWRQHPGSWSVAECLDHLAASNRVYLDVMVPAAERALAEGRRRRGPATPGLIGGWIVWMLEPPVRKRFRMRAPENIRPRVGPSLGDAAARFAGTHDEVRGFLARYADLDLAGVTFPSPLARALRFSLATGLHELAAHERRHLWQARRVRAAAIYGRSA